MVQCTAAALGDACGRAQSTIKKTPLFTKEMAENGQQELQTSSRLKLDLTI